MSRQLEKAYILLCCALLLTNGFQYSVKLVGPRSKVYGLPGKKPDLGIPKKREGVSRRVLISASLATLGVGIIGLTVHASENSTHLNSLSNQKSIKKPIKSINGTNTRGLKLAPINLTTVAAENRINVSLMCPPTILSQDAPCITVDRKTLNKVIALEFPNWVPTWLRPKPKVIREIPNGELMQSAIIWVCGRNGSYKHTISPQDRQV